MLPFLKDINVSKNESSRLHDRKCGEWLKENVKQGQERGEIAEKGESKYNSLVSGGNKKTLSEIGLTAQAKA